MLLQILNGSGSANSPKIVLSHRPDSTYSYSGLIQRTIEASIARQSYRAWFAANVPGRLGMSSSSFELGPPASLAPSNQVAGGHGSNGARIAGGRNRYPESAATGLYTPPNDLARIVIMLNQRCIVGGRRFLPANLVYEVMTPAPFRSDVGLGCFVGGSSSNSTTRAMAP